MWYEFSNQPLVKRKLQSNICGDCIFMIVKTHLIFKEVKDRNMISDPQHPSLYSTVSAISTAADGLTVHDCRFLLCLWSL